MTTKVIESSEIEGLKISSLPTNPTAHVNYGGMGYNAIQMKAAFDALPLFIIERLNSLINDIGASPDSSVSASIKTGISPSHTLSQLFSDLTDGSLASYLMIGERTLAEELAAIKRAIEALGGEVADE